MKNVMTCGVLTLLKKVMFNKNKYFSIEKIILSRGVNKRKGDSLGNISDNTRIGKGFSKLAVRIGVSFHKNDVIVSVSRESINCGL